MSQLDDLFREGLGSRKADLANANDLWARISAAKNAPIPEGEALDQTFREGLAGRQADVPAGMWQRIVAARSRRPMTKWLSAAALLLLLLTAGGLGYSLLKNDAAPLAPKSPEFSTEQYGPVADNSTPKLESEVMGDNAVREDAVTDAIPTKARQAIRELLPDNPVIPSGNELNPDDTKTQGITNASAPRPNAMAVSPLKGEAFSLVTEERAIPEANIIPSKFKSTAALRGFQTELLFGVSYARQELLQLEAGGTQLRDLREASEFPEFGYQITLRSTYHFTDRLRILAGLTYAEIRNELDYNLFVNGTDTRIISNNNIRMLEAPVLLGYSVPGRRVNVTVNAGPLINLTTGARGRFLHPSSAQPLDLRTNGNYRSNIGLGFMTSLTTAYQIGEERPFTLLIEPFFKAYPTAFTVKGAPLREKYWVVGLQLGVRKHL